MEHSEPIVMVVRDALLPEGARPGDRVVIQPGAEHPIVLVRPLPVNYGRHLLYAEQGATQEDLTRSPGDALSRLARLASSDSPPPPRRESRRPA